MKQKFLFLAWLTALIATLGSLFFSEIMGYPPCVLCWYQRICMYPMVLILGTALLYNDSAPSRYILPLASVGWLIAGYHNLLYYKILPESVAPCKQGISCTSIHIEWLGFITIPLLSIIAFTGIITLDRLQRRSHE